jgi:4-amino-4-deoxy-L-arabinose transferase-like glycosyltransferase
MSSRRTPADVAIFFALLIATTILVGATAQSLGFTRDEGYYFKAGELYWHWFAELANNPSRALSNDGIQRAWSYNHEHPAIMKTLFAFGYGMRDVLGIAAHNALRFPAWIVSGLSVSLVFALARTLLPRRAAIFAALLWLSLPHPFWHMHVACFDIGITAAHTALVLAYIRWRRTLRGALGVGAVFGIAAGVKHNVLVVPPVFVLHWLLTEAEPASSTSTGWRLPRIPLVFFALAIVGPLVYLLHWPWLWPDPFVRWGQYIGYHLNHEHYPILYFGDLLTTPPFPIHFPFVMSAVTIPVPALVLMGLGFILAVLISVRFLRARFGHSDGRELEVTRVPLGDVAKDPSGSTALLLVMNAAFPFILIALPSTPIFGGTKHWMNGLPFLVVLGAWILEEGCARLEASGIRKHVFAILAVLIVLPGAFISARVWPYGLGSYNELIGFARGAANVGMQRTFWGYEPREALPMINARTPPRGRIHFGDTNNDSFHMYKRDKLLRDDIQISGTVRGSDVAAVQPQGEFKQQWIDVWNEWDDRSPDIVLHAEGVPVGTVTFHR